ncbi:MAG: filamentous hemagglutinin N-terminal domain-containing protein [Selenomonas sp.]|nr:filamentous hemagglutinin N-terminal domain-containing protein [Selenomonas sp.]
MSALTSRGKGWKRFTAAVCAGLMAGAFSFLLVAEALRGGELPQGGVSSTALIKTDGGTMNITGAENNVIKWVSFSIDSGNAVNFDGNNYLNYVTGHARSDIMGTLTGGGQIYLVNPNGILIGDNARIDVGSLYLSTRNLTPEQLMDFATATGSLVKAGDPRGDVINLGKLNADVITVEGKNITFKNVADVTKGDKLENGDIAGGTLNDAVSLTAKGGEIHLGYAYRDGGTYADGHEATDSDADAVQYTSVSDPTLTGWTITGADPTYYMLVRNENELNNMRQNNLEGNYMLERDISDATVWSLSDESMGAYKGKFDGLNHKLANLTIWRDAGRQCGLFASSEGGTIENLKISGITFIDGYGCGSGGDVGTFVGYNNGTIKNVRNTGSMTIDFGGRHVGYLGGIAGRNAGIIENAYNTADISYDDTYFMGGIVGENQGQGMIANSFNSGAIKDATEGFTLKVGGIAGEISGTIENTYNTGELKGGNALEATSSKGIIYVGGRGGIAMPNGYTPGTIKNSYYTNDPASLLGHNSDGGTPITEAELKSFATFGGSWNISKDGQESTDWRIYEGQTAPLLTAFMTAKDSDVSTATYDGSKDVGFYDAAST